MGQVRRSKSDKALDDLFYSTYNLLGKGVQINMLDIGKLHAEAVASAKTGTPMNEAVTAVIAKYRKN